MSRLTSTSSSVGNWHCTRPGPEEAGTGGGTDGLELCDKARGRRARGHNNKPSLPPSAPTKILPVLPPQHPATRAPQGPPATPSPSPANERRLCSARSPKESRDRGRQTREPWEGLLLGLWRQTHQDVVVEGLTLADGGVEGDGDESVRLLRLREDEEPRDGGEGHAELLRLPVELEERRVHLHVEAPAGGQDRHLTRTGDSSSVTSEELGVRKDREGRGGGGEGRGGEGRGGEERGGEGRGGKGGGGTKGEGRGGGGEGGREGGRGGQGSQEAKGGEGRGGEGRRGEGRRGEGRGGEGRGREEGGGASRAGRLSSLKAEEKEEGSW